MRLLQVQLHSGTGGAESVAQTLEHSWREAGHTVQTVALTDADSGHSAQAEDWRSPMRRLGKLRRRIRSYRPDMIVAHATIAGMYARVAALASGHMNPVLVVGHSASDDYEDRRLLVAETLVSLLNPAVWLCVSEPVRQALITRPIRGRATATLVGNPVPTEFAELPRAPVPGRILMLGRVVPQKDVITAVDAVAIIAQVRHSAHLVVAGATEDKAYLDAIMNRVRQQRIEDRVSFLGARDDVPALLTSAHVLLHTAVREAASQTLREAYAARVPIVTSAEAASGVPDVRPFASFPSGDPEAAADLVLRALESDQSARGGIEPHLTPSAVAAAYLDHWSTHRRPLRRKRIR